MDGKKRHTLNIAHVLMMGGRRFVDQSRTLSNPLTAYFHTWLEGGQVLHLSAKDFLAKMCIASLFCPV